MHRRLAVLALLVALVAAGSLPFSGATFTAASKSGTRIGAAADWTPPSVTLADPGAILRGTVTLTATATDERSAVTSVTFQRAVAGSGAWVSLCTVTTAPYTCAFDTRTVADGTYDLRATTVDAAGYTAASSVRTSTINNITVPTVVLTDPGDFLRGTVTLVATGSDPGWGIASVRIQRALAGTTTWTDVCNVTAATASCPLVTTSLANDFYDLRAIATNNNGQVSEPDVIEDVLIDNLAPTVTMTNPGSPIRGTITLGATAADTGSGVETVTIQIAVTGTGTWTTACTTTAAPWTCRFDTTALVDRGYDFRAVATDLAGNSATSAAVTNRVVDNAQSSISMEDPGAFLSGTVELRATPFSNAGITSVRVQRAPNGSNTWTDVCTVTVAPYSCAWDTRTVADGLYDFRAILVDGAAKTTTSATVSARRVDNSPLRGIDVQSTNGGGTVGKVEVNDTLSLTYSKVIRPSSLITGWAGTPISVAVRIRDGGLVGLANIDDQLDVFTTTALGTRVNVGTVNMKGDFVKGGKTAVFNATITLQTTTVNGVEVSRVVLTMGTLASGSVRTSGSTAHMIWTPSSSALDLAGTACSAAPVAETGALDKDF